MEWNEIRTYQLETFHVIHFKIVSVKFRIFELFSFIFAI